MDGARDNFPTEFSSAVDLALKYLVRAQPLPLPPPPQDVAHNLAGQLPNQKLSLLQPQGAVPGQQQQQQMEHGGGPGGAMGGAMGGQIKTEIKTEDGIKKEDGGIKQEPGSLQGAPDSSSSSGPGPSTAAADSKVKMRLIWTFTLGMVYKGQVIRDTFSL